MIVSDLVALLGFQVDDSGLKKFDKLVEGANTNVDALLSSFLIKPSIDDSSVRELGETVRRTKQESDSLSSKKIKPETDTEPVEELGEEVDKTKKKTESLTAAFIKAQAIMGIASEIIGSAFSFVRDSVTGATAETERYRVALGTMLGDNEKAAKIIRDLDYGEGMFEGSKISDFYGTAAAIGGLQNMVTFGMAAEEAGDVLVRIGDIAQGNGEAFNSMAANFGQIFTKGKADATDLKQFAAQGFDVVGEVARASGESREEIEKAGVTYDQTKAALTALTSEGGKYSGMLAKQANTLGGIIKQFDSFKAATAEAIGTGISDELKDLLNHILEIGKEGQDTFVVTFVKVLKDVIHWISQVISMFEVLKSRIEDSAGGFDAFTQFFEDLRSLAEPLLTGIMNLVVSLGMVFMQAFTTAYAFIGHILRNLGGLIQSVFGFISDGVMGAMPILQMGGDKISMAELNEAIIVILNPRIKRLHVV